MVNASLCKTARPAFFFARPRLFEFFGLQDRDSDPTLALQKIRHCEMFRTAWKTRLRDPWNSTKILRDLYFFRDHSPPLYLEHYIVTQRVFILSSDKVKGTACGTGKPSIFSTAYLSTSLYWKKTSQVCDKLFKVYWSSFLFRCYLG